MVLAPGCVQLAAELNQTYVLLVASFFIALLMGFAYLILIRMFAVPIVWASTIGIDIARLRHTYICVMCRYIYMGLHHRYSCRTSVSHVYLRHMYIYIYIYMGLHHRHRASASLACVCVNVDVHLHSWAFPEAEAAHPTSPIASSCKHQPVTHAPALHACARPRHAAWQGDTSDARMQACC